MGTSLVEMSGLGDKIVNFPSILRVKSLQGREKSRTRFMQKLLSKTSGTYGKLIPELPLELQKDLRFLYLFLRAVDIVEDTPQIAYEQKREGMDILLSTFQNPSDEYLQTIGPKLLELTKPKEESFRILLEHTPQLAREYRELPQNVQETILTQGSEMAYNLISPDFDTMEDVSKRDRYCHWAAGLPGFMISTILHNRGYISKQTLDEVITNPKDERTYVNLANDVGVSFQDMNDLGDVREDVPSKIYRFPFTWLQEEGIPTYDALINPATPEDFAKSEKVLMKMIDHATPLIIRSNEYINKMPKQPEGIRNFLGLGAVGCAAKARVGKNLFRDGRVHTGEKLAIYEKVRAIVSRQEDLAGLVEHTLVRPAQEYKIG